jgi:peroxiredoxin
MPGFILGVRIVLAAVFAVAGVAKLLDAAGSRAALEGFGVPRRAARAAGTVLPVAELAIAAGLLVPASAWWSALAAAGLLAVFTAAIGVSMARGAAPGCHCFGRLHSAPVSWRTQLRNGVLAAAGGVAVLAGRGASGLSPVRWAGHLNAAELGLAAAVVVLCAAAAGQGWLLYRLSRQNGRVLARLDNLEQRIRTGGTPATAGLTGARPASGQGPVRGLAVGVPAPGFELPAADGRLVSLRALVGRGLPVLLLFSDPGCGHCKALLPQVAGWQHQHRDRLTVALATRRPAGQNAATPQTPGLRDVLLQANREIAEAYQANGTPSAVLIAANGTIASPLASGAQAITQLIHSATTSGLPAVPAAARAAGPRSQDKPGPAAGAAAPGLARTDLPVPAERGRRVQGQPVPIPHREL